MASSDPFESERHNTFLSEFLITNCLLWIQNYFLGQVTHVLGSGCPCICTSLFPLHVQLKELSFFFFVLKQNRVCDDLLSSLFILYCRIILRHLNCTSYLFFIRGDNTEGWLPHNILIAKTSALVSPTACSMLHQNNLTFPLINLKSLKANVHKTGWQCLRRVKPFLS